MLKITATAPKKLKVDNTAPSPKRATDLYEDLLSAIFAPKTPAQNRIVSGLEIVRINAVIKALVDEGVLDDEKLGIIKMLKLVNNMLIP